MAYLKSVCCPGLAIYLEKEEGVTKGREEREGKNPGGGDAGGTAIDEAIAMGATMASILSQVAAINQVQGRQLRNNKGQIYSYRCR